MPRTPPPLSVAEDEEDDDASYTLKGAHLMPEDDEEQEEQQPPHDEAAASSMPPATVSMKKRSNKAKKKKKKKKILRFANTEAEVVGCVPLRSDLSADEIRDSWWSAKEYQGIRLGAKFLTKDVRSRDKELITGIEEAYARALHLACSLSDDDFDHLIQDCSSQTACLKPWCARRLSARGLERYTSKKHRFERTEYAVETRAAVLRLAQNGDVTQEELSVFYREYARSAALYARFCGQADHAVVAATTSTPTCPCTGVCSGLGSCCSRNKSNNDMNAHQCNNKYRSMNQLDCIGKLEHGDSSNSTLPTVSTTSSSTSSPTASPTKQTTTPCDGRRRELLRRSKEPSRGRLLVRELSQRRIETAV